MKVPREENIQTGRLKLVDDLFLSVVLESNQVTIVMTLKKLMRGVE